MKGYAAPNSARTIGSASHASIRAALESKAADVRADEAAAWLAAMNDDDFLAIVERDARDQLPPEVADVLGHPAVCDRWNQALKTLHMRSAGMKGATVYRAALAERRARAVHAIQYANEQSHVKRATVGKTASPRHRAIDRLILAHPDEFAALVFEEQASGGAA